tara:strand:- start:568 stop:1200 length:633 start_codon:yes stop_codon:yes gene_type:complete
MAVSKTTKLDAINSMLIGIGEAPVNTLNSGLQEAEVAAILLDNISREVQSQGWSFNTDIRYKLTPDSSKIITLPSHTLQVDTTKIKRDYNTDVIERNGKLYDRTKNTFEFDDDVEVDIVFLFDFNEIPEVARRYITLRAGRKFQENILGSGEMTQLQFKDEQSALFALRDADSQTADFNIFDNYDTYAAIDRIGIGAPVNVLDTQRRLYS